MTKIPPPAPDDFRRTGKDQVAATAERIDHENEFRDWVVARIDDIYKRLKPTPKRGKL